MKRLLIILFLFYTPNCFAISEVGSGTQRAATTTDSELDYTTLDFPNLITASNWVVVGGTAYSSTAVDGPASVSVTAACATLALTTSSVAGSHTIQFIAYGLATSESVCTITVDPAGAAYISFAIDEFSQAGSLDQDAGNYNGTGTTASEDITTGVDGALIFSVMTHGTSTQTVTPDGDYTEIGAEDDCGTYQCYSVVFRVVTTPTTYTPSWTIADNVAWRVHTVSFAPSAPPATTAGNIIVIMVE